MIINVFDQQDSLILSLDQIQKIVKQVILEENQACNEVNLYFVNTPTICDLHQQYFNDPSPTDCISFPMDEEHHDDFSYRILGEIFVCHATAKLYATLHHKDPYEEVILYIIHGLLHLMGYDDIEREDRKKMRQAEKRQMKKIKALGLYPSSFKPGNSD